MTTPFFKNLTSALRMGITLSVCALAFAVAACGETQPLQQGFTACGNVTCQPGQYCFGGGVCANGCLSSINCADDQACVDEDDSDGAGVCVDPDSTGEGEGEGEGGSCDAYAVHAASCGLRASEAAALTQACAQLSNDERTALMACDAATSCTEFRACSGVECFRDDHCTSDAPHCLMREEVVDPFTDIPYRCVE